MDTTTVDYAITKLNEAFAAIQPTAIELGTEYINYTVFKAVLLPIITTVLCVVFIFVGLRLYGERQKAKNNEHRSARGEEVKFEIGASVSVVIAVVLGAVTVGALWNMTLALYNPLMFTIDKLAK